MDNKIRTKQLFGKYYTNSFEELILRHEIPNNWTWVTVGSIADLKTGATPSTTNPSYYGGNIKWLVSGDIHGNEIFDCEKRITIEGMRNSNCTLLPADSILIALNGQGKTRATVALLKCEATCNQSLVAIIPYLNDYYHSKYIYYALKVNYYQIRDITGQTKRRGLNMKLVSQLPIPLPPLSEQKRIVEEIEKQFAKTKQLKEHIIANQQATEQLLKALLHQAFLPVPQAGEVEEMVTV
jgi:type I restriction enzyme S subunit